MARNINRQRTIRDVAERIASAGLIVVPLAVIVLWLLLHYKPPWYHPAMLDAKGMQRARRQALSMADSISDQMVQRAEFDVILTDVALTEWIAALGSIWPEAAAQFPPELSEVAVAFDGGVVRIAARYRSSWQAIVSVHLTLGVSADGSKIQLQLLGVNGGTLPIPSSMIERMLASRIEPRASANEAPSRQAKGAERLIRWLESPSNPADARMANQTHLDTENRFVWFNGRRPYRILSIEVVEGALRLRIEPL